MPVGWTVYFYTCRQQAAMGLGYVAVEGCWWREKRPRNGGAYRERGGDFLRRHLEQTEAGRGFEEWRGANGRSWWCCARYGVVAKLDDVREARMQLPRRYLPGWVSAATSHLIRPCRTSALLTHPSCCTSNKVTYNGLPQNTIAPQPQYEVRL